MSDLDQPANDGEVTPTITPEDVKQLTKSIKEIYKIHGYRPVSSNEFDVDCSYEDFIAARRAGKSPTKIFHGNFTHSEDHTLSTYVTKS